MRKMTEKNTPKEKKDSEEEKKELEEKEVEEEQSILKNKKVLTIIALLAAALIVTNIYIFMTPKRQETCYVDLCIYSEQDPVQHFEELLQTSEKSYLLIEGDVEMTNETGQISHAAVKMAELLSSKAGLDENIHSIGYRDGEPVECDGGNKTVEQCQNIEPKENELLLHMKYPDYPDQKVNEVIIENRTITIKAKTGQDLTAATEFLKMKFL